MPQVAKKELQRSLTHCGACRIKLEALRDAGLDVTDEYERLEKTQQASEALLKLWNSERGVS